MLPIIQTFIILSFVGCTQSSDRKKIELVTLLLFPTDHSAQHKKLYTKWIKW